MSEGGRHCELTDLEVNQEFIGPHRKTTLRLPVRSHPGVARRAFVILIASLVLFSIPCGFGIFFWWGMHRADPTFRLFSALMAVSFFGLFLFPVALLALLYSSYLWRGRTEIVCEPDQLRVVHRLGPAWWSSRLPLAHLNGFRVIVDQEADFESALGILCADYTSKGTRILCSGYPLAFLQRLADELACRSQETSRQKLALVPTTHDNPDPRQIGPRTDQPSDSNAVVRISNRCMTIDLPSPGAWRCIPRFLIFFCITWNLFVLAFFGFFIPALFAGKVMWNDGPEKTSIWFGLLFSLPFFGVGAGMLAYWRYNAIRSASLALTDREMTFRERRLFGEMSCAWKLGDIRSVQAVCREHTSEDSVSWSNSLQINSTDGLFECLSWRKKSELEWLATTISQALQVS
jgi:hypothetical protein